MREKRLFIAIEGVDGTFKTTVAKIIASDCNFQYYKTPNNCFSPFKRVINDHANPLERYCFYRLATQVDSRQIKQLLKTTSVVCDRYYQSTYAYHIVKDPMIKDIHDDFGIIKPDISFILNARPDIRDQRIKERTKKLNEVDDVEAKSDFLNRVAEIFKQFKTNCFHIDTSDITSIEVATIIKNIIFKTS
ncbi:MAG: hypothetical protein PHR00_02725 [Patescibacteria group bacterium]|nr:hypothetical protein [Patescibacteria group bacterium]